MDGRYQENQLTRHTIYILSFKKIKNNIILKYDKNGREVTGQSPATVPSIYVFFLGEIKLIRSITPLRRGHSQSRPLPPITAAAQRSHPTSRVQRPPPSPTPRNGQPCPVGDSSYRSTKAPGANPPEDVLYQRQQRTLVARPLAINIVVVDIWNSQTRAKKHTDRRTSLRKFDIITILIYARGIRGFFFFLLEICRRTKFNYNDQLIN